MNIQFTVGNESILLRADSFNYELCKIRKNKSEESGEVVETWEPFKYFASLHQALNRLLDMRVRASDATDLKQLADDLEAVRAEIMAAWKTVIMAQ